MCAGICKLHILYTVYVRSISRVPATKLAGFWTYAEKRLPASFSIWTTIWLQPVLKISGVLGIRFEKDFRLLERGE